jgi:hypothetical protein
VIERNDTEIPEDERKEWAMKLMPRILGTRLGMQAEDRARNSIRGDFRRNFERKHLLSLQEGLTKTDDPDLRERMKEDIDSLQPYGTYTERVELAFLDAKIEAMIGVFEREKAGRAKRAATLALKSKEKARG